MSTPQKTLTAVPMTAKGLRGADSDLRPKYQRPKKTKTEAEL